MLKNANWCFNDSTWTLDFTEDINSVENKETSFISLTPLACYKTEDNKPSVLVNCLLIYNSKLYHMTVDAWDAIFSQGVTWVCTQ